MSDYIDKAVALNSQLYVEDASRIVDISFRNPNKREQIYTNVTDKDVTNNTTNSFNKGVMHVVGCFDIELKATITTNEVDGKVVKTISYFFVLYNIDYNNLGFTSTNDLLDHINIAYVEGVGEGKAETEDDEIFGDAALDKMMDDGLYSGDQAFNGFKHSYSYVTGKDSSGNDTYSSFDSYIYDKSSIRDEEKMELESLTDPVCVLESTFLTNGDGDSFDEMESITFAIYKTSESLSDSPSGNSHETLIEGTIENIIQNNDINEEVEAQFYKGYNNNLTSAPQFLKHAWPNIVIFTSIALVVSSVLAVLFYLIWIDDKQQPKKR